MPESEIMQGMKREIQREKIKIKKHLAAERPVYPR